MPRPPSDIKEQLVKAARARFLTQGVDGASLRSIAQDAGTNIGMVYYYFKTKDDLFFAVVEDVYGGILRDVAAILGTQSHPEERLRALYQRIARIDEPEFDVLRLVLREAMVSSERMRRLVARFEQGHVPMVLAALSEGLAQGRFDARVPPVALLAATASLAILPQIVHRLISGADLPIAALLPSREEAARALADVLLFGIAGPALRERGEHAPGST